MYKDTNGPAASAKVWSRSVVMTCLSVGRQGEFDEVLDAESVDASMICGATTGKERPPTVIVARPAACTLRSQSTSVPYGEGVTARAGSTGPDFGDLRHQCRQW